MLAWLLGEPAAPEVADALADAQGIVASDLTLVEGDRGLIRAQTLGALTEAKAAGLRMLLHSASAHWELLRVDHEVVERARRPFPEKPIRALDALHLASALVARAKVGEIALLSLDHRIRRAGRALGLPLVPARHGRNGPHRGPT